MLWPAAQAQRLSRRAIHSPSPISTSGQNGSPKPRPTNQCHGQLANSTTPATLANKIASVAGVVLFASWPWHWFVGLGFGLPFWPLVLIGLGLWIARRDSRWA